MCWLLAHWVFRFQYLFYTLHKRHAVYYQKNVGYLRCVILSIILNRWWKWHTKEQRTLTSCLSSISSLAILRNLAKWRRLVCIFSSLLISLWSAPWLVLEHGQINMSDFFPILPFSWNPQGHERSIPQCIIHWWRRRKNQDLEESWSR